MNEFKEQYKDDRWKRQRIEILKRDKFKCRACGAKKVVLDVHHLYYDMDLKIWQYDNDALVTLCRDCHAKIHLDLKKVSGLIAFKLLCCEIDLVELDEKLNKIINYY